MLTKVHYVDMLIAARTTTVISVPPIIHLNAGASLLTVALVKTEGEVEIDIGVTLIMVKGGSSGVVKLGEASTDPAAVRMAPSTPMDVPVPSVVSRPGHIAEGGGFLR